MSKTEKILMLSTGAIVAFVCGTIVITDFIRARNTPASNACVNNLRQLDGAIQQCALESQKKSGDKVTMSDIAPYLAREPRCPQGGEYAIGPSVSSGVSCSFSGHTLPR